MPVDYSLLRSLKQRVALHREAQAPKIKPNTARYFVLLYVCTDPPGSWTQKDMLIELQDLGVPKSTARYAIEGLSSRGLIKKNKVDHMSTTLWPTYAGTQAIKPFLPENGRVQL